MKLNWKSVLGLSATGVLMLFLASAPMQAQDAAATFKAKCAMCHGADGKAETPIAKKMNIRSFASPEVQKMSDAEVTQIIEKGKDKMPAYGSKLSASDIKGLVTYIRGLGK